MINVSFKRCFHTNTGAIRSLVHTALVFLALLPYNELFACSPIRTIQDRQRIETATPVIVDYKPVPYFAAVDISTNASCGESGALRIYLKSQPNEFSKNAHLVFNVVNGKYPDYLETVFDGAVSQNQGAERDNSHGLGAYIAYFRRHIDSKNMYEPISVTLTVKVITSEGFESKPSDPFSLESSEIGGIQVFRLAKWAKNPSYKQQLRDKAVEITSIIIENRLPESQYSNVTSETFEIEDVHKDQIYPVIVNVIELNKEFRQLAKKYSGINEFHDHPRGLYPEIDGFLSLIYRYPFSFLGSKFNANIAIETTENDLYKRELLMALDSLINE